MSNTDSIDRYEHDEIYNYITTLGSLLLGGCSSSDKIFDSLKSIESKGLIESYINDSKCRVVVLEKTNSGDLPDNEKYHVCDKISYNVKCSCVIFIKRSGTLDKTQSLGSQINVINFGEGSPYELLFSYMNQAVNPFLKSYIRSNRGLTRDEDKIVPSVERNMTEMEMGLLHLQQNISIPKIDLATHPTVAEIVAQGDPNPDLKELINDSDLLNSIQAYVNRWIIDIRKVTKLERDVNAGSALQEITFWLSLERALLRINEKRKSPEVVLSLEILRLGKRFMVTVGFESDIALKERLDIAINYNLLMKDFPIKLLLSANSIAAIKDALIKIFGHFSNVSKTNYPIQRSIELINAISADLNERLLDRLNGEKLLTMPFEDFKSLIDDYHGVFNIWVGEYEKMRKILRDMVPNPSKERIKISRPMIPVHKSLETRLNIIEGFRDQHNQLTNIISHVWNYTKNIDSGSEVFDIVSEINSAYDLVVKELNMLDLSEEGNNNLNFLFKKYNERIERVENFLVGFLTKKLTEARNTNEMFKIFSRFHVLFVRRNIKGALREYQTQLLQNVKDDVSKLQAKFKAQFYNSSTSVMCQNLDIPSVSGFIMWARQIERQLMVLLKKVEYILGQDWKQHLEGKAIKEIASEFRASLDPTEIFNTFLSRVDQRNLSVTGSLFTVDTMTLPNGDSKLFLKVNFSTENIELCKELLHLKSLGFRIMMNVYKKLYDSMQFYHLAICLIEDTRLYHEVKEMLESDPDVQNLAAGDIIKIQDLISEGFLIAWQSHRLSLYIQNFSESILLYRERTIELISVVCEIENEVKSLNSCDFSFDSFHNILEKIQGMIDKLDLKRFTNVSFYIEKLDSEIEKILSGRCETAILEWIACLKSTDSGKKTNQIIKKIIFELKMSNKTIFLTPQIEYLRSYLYDSFTKWINNCLSLPRLRQSRYQMSLEDGESVEPLVYRNLLSLLPSSVVMKCYEDMEDLISTTREFTEKWFKYQSLWNLDSNFGSSKCETNIKMWISLLNFLKKNRTQMDTVETTVNFGPVVVDYTKVQSKVIIKYEALLKDYLDQFGHILGSQMSSLHSKLSSSRSFLEASTLTGSDTSEFVATITSIQTMKRQTDEMNESIETFEAGQKLLDRERYPFPDDWPHYENIEGEWSAFASILARKDEAVQNQLASLQVKIVAEDKAIASNISEIYRGWDSEKPLSGEHIGPDDALALLQIYERKFNKALGDRKNIADAKKALGMHDSGKPSHIDDHLNAAIEEVDDLKTVWLKIKEIWNDLDDLKETLFITVQPRKLKAALEEFAKRMVEMPSQMKNYEIFEYVQKTLKGYIKANTIITEMKSDAVKERHWKMLTKEFGVSWYLPELTVGDIWKINLEAKSNAIRTVMATAQGELALEEYIKMVTETWKNYVLELTNYQNKSQVIKGWTELFNKLKEHIDGMSSMKLSPYYAEFRNEAVSWEEKLIKVNTIFDIWIEVQRRWIYLDGVFSGSSDIKALLPAESQRFSSMSNEFMGIMKKVAKCPYILEVIELKGLDRHLERFDDLLNKIQKALGEYLERERSSFPRFFFVGDEDLLDIIGNAKNLPKLQKHFKKLFAGVYSMLSDDEMQFVTGVMSKEGESLMFSESVSIASSINQWLGNVEKQIKYSLASQLDSAIKSYTKSGDIKLDQFVDWIDEYQDQIIILSMQILWTNMVTTELCKETDVDLNLLLDYVNSVLNMMADAVLLEQPFIRRRKFEHLITEMVHLRDVTRFLIDNQVQSIKDFNWLKNMRFYFDDSAKDPLERFTICMANTQFYYGYEYLGLQDRIVQTPLTDRCYLAMTQALNSRLGGSPFGPAGTGKTESVKALGCQFGRLVLVFNCDDKFDFQAVGRIFIGLCQVGAWGCFDEFNRLEERMLSAVSQQIQAIQESLKKSENHSISKVELLGRNVSVDPNMAIFITMNPGYAGRSNLPDNLKKLFRSLSMTQPDRQLIAQVMLFSQGFKNAEIISSKVVPFFELCKEQLSLQTHYDFGLRALKSVLVSAGNIKRSFFQQNTELNSDNTAQEIDKENKIVVLSITETMVPKLVGDDIFLLKSLLCDFFPGTDDAAEYDANLINEIHKVCEEMHLCHSHDSPWIEKIKQLYQISLIHHGLMMVGPSGNGKSTAWRVLLAALSRLEGTEGISHVIDPKSYSKDLLYGSLDPNTREWQDGLFTSILRRIIDNVKGDSNRRHWIIFDGDVDPEWVENLNSVLDDNKLLTLPNGERLALPPNIRIMFEVQDLRYATLATVSRCGMIWFSDNVITFDIICEHYLQKLDNVLVIDTDELTNELSDPILVQRNVRSFLIPLLEPGGLIFQCLQFSEGLDHVMEFTRQRALNSLFGIIDQGIRNVLQYSATYCQPTSDMIESYITKYILVAIMWSFVGDSSFKVRNEMDLFIRNATTFNLPADSMIIDYDITIDGEWVSWLNRVPSIEIHTHQISTADIVIPTMDTIRHESLLTTWINSRRPLVLCGPPGSGKTMTLFNTLKAMPNMDLVLLNFSGATTPSLLLKTFDQYCEYRRTPNGLVMSPKTPGNWLIVFCDEINLPDYDKYGTQHVISFMRQLIEHGGFYRSQVWVKFERIQFLGACNPPTDQGRKPLPQRFLRHIPILYVDYPMELSLKQIYGTFNRALLKIIPHLSHFNESLTDSMIEFYMLSQEKFSAEIQPHYIYSPRELTRWVRGIGEALNANMGASIQDLIRILVHEGLRLFRDRLINDDERLWTDQNMDMIIHKHFSSIDLGEALTRPILYSDWLSSEYSSVQVSTLRDYVNARLKVFYEEQLDVPLVLYDEMLDYVLRIDRVLKQPQGHMLIIGTNGSGRATLARFVAWINGFNVTQIKVHNNYTGNDFDEDLRTILRRVAYKSERIVLIMDESNVVDSSFLERMNTLLANGEIPGLFEGDEMTKLLNQCKEASIRDGLILDSSEELYKWFTHQIMRNLHVVFTMNPSEEGLKDKASASPALFNRCVLNWFGDWSRNALYQVASEFLNRLDLESQTYDYDVCVEVVIPNSIYPLTLRNAITNAMIHIHESVRRVNEDLRRKKLPSTFLTPRNYLDMINHYVSIFNEKKLELEEQQLHIDVGLRKINETVQQVDELRKSLTVKRADLDSKNEAANAKLQQMLREQQEAEKRRTESSAMREEIKSETEHIIERQSIVNSELSLVEPAVNEAKLAVKSIKRQNLVEIKALNSPPSSIKLAVESVATLLGEKNFDWKSLRSFIMRENFIPTVINFVATNIPDDVRTSFNKKFSANPEYNFERVNRASAACGPLVKWALAQINYSEILNKVSPLRNELKSLESRAETKRKKMEELNNLINDLENSIVSYKEEYALLISEVQAIKSDMNSVEIKVKRSVDLLSNLSDEGNRWKTTSQNFLSQINTVAGDSLLSAAFLSYSGYYDQNVRDKLYKSWINILSHSNIPFRNDLARIEFMSSPDERLEWQTNELPMDDLCIENAIMLKRFLRFPLVIDPSGQAVNFISKHYANKKITTTSFLDMAFRKTLESSMRFGNPLLIHDVENYDNIMNPLLNREIKRIGGRVVVTIGDQDIDLSPTFSLIFITRDNTFDFPSDICSRVTFVNFTVTRGSLTSQCLNYTLKTERPDIETKRKDLLRLQGEFNLTLRKLEKSLLNSLNQTKGRILDDDIVLTKLENLKKESSVISQKMKDNCLVMAEVEAVLDLFRPLAVSCSSIFFTLQSLSQIHFLYQFSLNFFLSIFERILSCSELKLINSYDDRFKFICNQLFQIIYIEVSASLLHQDRITFALLLARIHIARFGGVLLDEEFNFLMNSYRFRTVNCAERAGLNPDQTGGLTALSSSITFFKDVYQKLENENIKNWIDSLFPESTDLPQTWHTGNAIVDSVNKLLLIQALRPDRVLAMSRIVVNNIMGCDFYQLCEKDANLFDISTNKVSSNTPVLLCSVVGYDASYCVQDMAKSHCKALTSVALGSSEGFVMADKALSSAGRTGSWVLLKNAHLSPVWLAKLEKKLRGMTFHRDFRLFISMEISSKLPSNLLRSGRVIIAESSTGIKANLFRTYDTVIRHMGFKPPIERIRFYFMMSWFHAIMQERQYFLPVGWTKNYEFNEADLHAGFELINSWIDATALGRSNLSPSKIPWNAIITLMSQSIYGAKIDNPFDQCLLDAFLNRFFSVCCFEDDFILIRSHDMIISPPNSTNFDDFIEWINNLSDDQLPDWLDLPNNIEGVLLVKKGQEMISNLLRVTAVEQSTMDDLSEEETYVPSWMSSLLESSLLWIGQLPKSLASFSTISESSRDPIVRYFEREYKLGSSLLQEIRNDVNKLIMICRRQLRQTNDTRSLISDITSGSIPSSWNRYRVPRSCNVHVWISDFIKRIEQLENVAKSDINNLKNVPVWLGGLFYPEAYFSATMQYVARSNNLLIENLVLEPNIVVNYEQMPADDNYSFKVTDVIMFGFQSKSNHIYLTNDVSSLAPTIFFRWKNNSEIEENTVKLPLYLNTTRSQCIMSMNFLCGEGQSQGDFYMRGVSLFCSQLD